MISSRCGRGICEYYDATNQISKCSKYADRKLCSLSMKRRRRNKYKSSHMPVINW